jgi:hypothetical protein
MYRLHVVSGPELGRSFDLDRDMFHIGRTPENEVQIKDRFISRRHLKVLKKGERYFLKDLESANGTFVDGNLIRPGVEVELPEGVPVVIGMSVFCLGEQCADDIIDVLQSLDASRSTKKDPPGPHTGRPGTVLKNMELLRDVSRVLTQSLDLKEVLDRILDSILSLLNRIDRGAIVLLEQETGRTLEVVSKARKGFEGDGEAYCRDVVDQVIRSGNEFMLLGEDQVLRDALNLSKIKSVMCVPLLNRSRVIGVIYVDSVTNLHGFRKDDLSFFKALSIPAAHAVYNALLYSRVRKDDARSQ